MRRVLRSLPSLHSAAGARVGACSSVAELSSLSSACARSPEAPSGPSTSSSSCMASSMGHLHRRSFAADAAGGEAEGTAKWASIGNEKVQKLAEEVVNLTVLESSWLSEILRKRLGIEKPAFGANMMAMPAAAAPAAAAPAAEVPKEAPKEKTDFEVKLASFSPEGKIKVIKEVRAITGLGLKEAKDLVEKAPVSIKLAVPKEEAEAMKKQIEAAGGKVELA